MRDPENIRAVSALDIDWMGFVFWRDSPRYLQQISSRTGTLPDYSSLRDDAMRKKADGKKDILRVGVFVDDMPQNIVTRVVNYRLDIVQLHGGESPVMMENLRRTIDPDIHPGIKLMKTIYVGCADDLKCCADYAGVADYFLFEPKKPADADTKSLIDWDVLASYDGQVPFILGGDIGPDDVERIRHFSHPAFCGISVDAQFETAYAMKDVVALKAFVECLRKGE
jgi:phosphoribosylanthranilate isomerase